MHEKPNFNDRETVRHIPTNVVLPVIYREKLRYLSQLTRIPQAEYIREAIRDLLMKYGQDLNLPVGATDGHGQ